MRTQLNLVITALGLCHLFLLAPVVTSQALASPAAVNSPAPAVQNGNCHLVLTAPPVFQKPASPDATPDQSKAQPKIAISESQPVEITARQCEKNNDVYILTDNAEIKFEGYDFQGDMVSYDAVSGEVTTTGNAALEAVRATFISRPLMPPTMSALTRENSTM